MEDGEKYLWRPNDSSPKTNLKYDLEAQHWLKSINNATPSPTPSFGQVTGFIGLLFSMTFNIIYLIILILIDTVKWVMKVWPKKKDKYDGVPTFANKPKLSAQDMRDIIKGAKESGIVDTVE